MPFFHKNDTGIYIDTFITELPSIEIHIKDSNCWVIPKWPVTKNMTEGLLQWGMSLQTQVLVLPSELKKIICTKGSKGRRKYMFPLFPQILQFSFCSNT